MIEIIHRVGINATPEKVYELLTTDKGLSQWWTDDVSGAGDVGSVIKFRFNGGGPDFVVTELVPEKIVRWKHSGDAPDEWVDTEVLFELNLENNQTFVKFFHSNWQKSTDFMGHCSTKWAVFMLSLKELAESGKGRPFPDDVQIES